MLRIFWQFCCVIFLHTHCFAQDHAGGSDSLVRDAEAGDAAAQTSLGVKKWRAIDTRFDPVGAEKWLRAAAKSGNMKAKAELSELIARGYTQKFSWEESLRLARAASEAGHPDGQAILGLHHLCGWGVPVDEEKGVELLSKASRGGSDWGRVVMLGRSALRLEGAEKRSREEIDMGLADVSSRMLEASAFMLDAIDHLITPPIGAPRGGRGEDDPRWEKLPHGRHKFVPWARGEALQEHLSRLRAFEGRGHPEAMLVLGMMAFRDQRYEECMDLWNRAASLGSRDAMGLIAINALVWQRGLDVCFARMNRFAARRLLVDAWNLGGHRPEFMQEVSTAYFIGLDLKNQEPQRAIAIAEEGILRRNPNGHGMLGFVYARRTRDLAKSVADTNRAVAHLTWASLGATNWLIDLAEVFERRKQPVYQWAALDRALEYDVWARDYNSVEMMDKLMAGFTEEEKEECKHLDRINWPHDRPSLEWVLAKFEEEYKDPYIEYETFGVEPEREEGEKD